MQLSRRFGRLYGGVIYDAMCFDLRWPRPFVVDPGIKSAWPISGGAVCGPAFTCRGEPVRDPQHVDDTVRIRMFDQFFPGCVQVIDTGGDREVAHFGDISGKIARKFGCIGAVIDGFTRDVGNLAQDQFPVFCAGAQPVDAFGRWQIVNYEEVVSLPGADGRVSVYPGDYIFGDPDGVLVLPRAHCDEICKLAEQRQEREDSIRRELAGTDDIQSLYERIGRW